MSKKVRAIATVEMMAVKEDALKKAIKDYVGKIENEKYLSLERKDYSKVSKVPTPGHPTVEEAFWQSCEIEAEFDTLRNLLFFTMIYGPSSVEIMGPKAMTIKMSEMQELVGGIAEFMHRFAAQGAGGIVYSSKAKK